MFLMNRIRVENDWFSQRWNYSLSRLPFSPVTSRDASTMLQARETLLEKISSVAKSSGWKVENVCAGCPQSLVSDKTINSLLPYFFESDCDVNHPCSGQLSAVSSIWQVRKWAYGVHSPMSGANLRQDLEENPGHLSLLGSQWGQDGVRCTSCLCCLKSCLLILCAIVYTNAY